MVLEHLIVAARNVTQTIGYLCSRSSRRFPCTCRTGCPFRGGVRDPRTGFGTVANHERERERVRDSNW